jgi:hypothetical protein
MHRVWVIVFGFLSLVPSEGAERKIPYPIKRIIRQMMQDNMI